MVARVNGHSSGLLRRIAALEVAAQVVETERDDAEYTLELWRRVHPAVQDYLGQYPQSSDWVAMLHPQKLAERALRAAQQGDDGLLPVQADVVKNAYCTLDWWHAHDLRSQRSPNMTVSDRLTHELASQELFGVGRATTHGVWSDDAAWLGLWERGSRDPNVLERSAIGQAELELLSASAPPRSCARGI